MTTNESKDLTSEKTGETTCRYMPLYDRIIVKLDEAAERSEGGILLPDVAMEKPQVGVIVAMGPGALHLESGEYRKSVLKIGDRVVVPRYAGHELPGGYHVLRDSDALAIDLGECSKKEEGSDG